MKKTLRANLKPTKAAPRTHWVKLQLHRLSIARRSLQLMSRRSRRAVSTAVQADAALADEEGGTTAPLMTRTVTVEAATDVADSIAATTAPIATTPAPTTEDDGDDVVALVPPADTTAMAAAVLYPKPIARLGAINRPPKDHDWSNPGNGWSCRNERRRNQPRPGYVYVGTIDPPWNL
jgi:hypothetical protein